MYKAAQSLYVLAALLLLPINGHAGLPASQTRDKMMQDLDIIKNVFEVKYAPAEWKLTYADWNLDDQIDLAKVKVLEAPDIGVKDYQRILLEFFNATKDYHVGVSFYSTENAVLPFRVHSARGKYYAAWVYDPLFAGLKDPLKKGDEVLLFNGRPIDEVVQELKKTEFGNPLSATDQALAESALTLRSGQAGNKVPKGSVSVTVRHAGGSQITTYRLNWFYSAEEITSPLSPFAAAIKSNLLQLDGVNFYASNPNYRKPLGEHLFFHKDMTAPLYRLYKKALSKRNLALQQAANGDDGEEDNFIGAKSSFVPLLGQVIWEAPQTSPFKAYIYRDKAGRNIGYVRIPHYMGANQSADHFAEIIRYFEENTDALVVDQLNNPGGNMFYMYAMAAILSDKPLLVPQHRMTITQEDVFFALDALVDLENVKNDEEARQVFGSNIAGYPVDLDLVQGVVKYMRFIIREWNEGRTFTDPEYIYGVDYLKPYPKGNYSKPLLLLVNELDFSCGDFLPATMQDNKRAKILGMRTAGAGGYVLEHSYPNLFGVQGFSFTGSIAQRADLNPIENLGVIPDIIVEPTVRDLEQNYADYTAQIHNAVNDLLK